MHACVRHKVDIVLTGSIRDDGPIPGVTTAFDAQRSARKLADVTPSCCSDGANSWRCACWRRRLRPSRGLTHVVARVTDHQPFQSLGLVPDSNRLRERRRAARSDSGAASNRKKVIVDLMRGTALPADHYGIESESSLMSRARGASGCAQKQWQGLPPRVDSIANPRVAPQQKCPYMAFTPGQRGLTVGKKFSPSNFRHKERAGEAPHFARWMEEHGYEIAWLPKDHYFEGEGDALFGGDTLFCGYKFRSDINSHRAVADMLGCLVISVELVDPRFYHLDTCFLSAARGARSGSRRHSMNTARHHSRSRRQTHRCFAGRSDAIFLGTAVRARARHRLTRSRADTLATLRASAAIVATNCR